MNDLTSQPPVLPMGEMRLDVPPLEHLSNGIPIYIINGGHDGVNRLSLFVRGGVLDEHKLLQAALTGHMATEGTAGRTRGQIAETLDYNGAWKSVRDYDDWTEISFSSLNANYAATLDVLCECLTEPAFRQGDLVPIQRQYASSYASMRRKVKHRASQAMAQMYYGSGHPLAGEVTLEAIMALTAADLREFHGEFYRTSNMFAVLSGEVTTEVRRLTDATLGALNVPGEPAGWFDWSRFSMPAEPGQQLVDVPGAVQSAIHMALPAVPRSHPDYFKIRVLAHVLGGYFGSRLMMNIRESKGYTYGVYAYLAGRAHDGYVGISTECDTAYTWPVIDEIDSELRHLCAEPVPDSELELVRQYMLSDLLKTLDTPLSVGGYVSSMVTFGMYADYFNRQVETIRTVTSGELLEVARRYLTGDRRVVAIAGDCNRLRT